MKIVFIHRAVFQKRPPVISAFKILISLGYNPILITCGINDEYKAELERHNIEYHIINFKLASSLPLKIYYSLYFRYKVFSLLKELSKINELLLWVEGNYTLVALGTKIKKYKYILQLQELYKKQTEKYILGRIINGAEIIFMPEYNRSVLYQVWFSLKKRPVVLPNKPYYIPNNKHLAQLKIKYKDLISELEGKKIILYQGNVCQERDLKPFIKAVKTFGDHYKFVILGKDYGVLSSYKEIYKDIIHIEHIDSPDYLLITSMAYIGIVTYVPDKLNSMYCAPNKIFEYSGFSIPMIGNDIPGLKYTIEKYNMGVIVDDTCQSEIVNAISTIESNYELYSTNADKFYLSVDNYVTIKSEFEIYQKKCAELL